MFTKQQHISQCFHHELNNSNTMRSKPVPSLLILVHNLDLVSIYKPNTNGSRRRWYEYIVLILLFLSQFKTQRPGDTLSFIQI